MENTISTTRGEMLESDLRKVVSEDKVECGVIEKTSYFAKDGELVRQDVNVKVDKGFLMGAFTKLV